MENESSVRGVKQRSELGNGAEGGSSFKAPLKRGYVLTKGTVYQTEGAALAIFCLGYQHPGHEGHSPLGKPSDTEP